MATAEFLRNIALPCAAKNQRSWRPFFAKERRNFVAVRSKGNLAADTECNFRITILNRLAMLFRRVVGNELMQR